MMTNWYDKMIKTLQLNGKSERTQECLEMDEGQEGKFPMRRKIFYRIEIENELSP